jgi:mRNA-degrading endonuclease YafQ of YafQ-DinJ toxin-antitoxin module
MMLFEHRVAPQGHSLVELVHGDGTSSGVECLMCPLEPLVYDTLCGFLPDDARAAEIGSFVGGSCCVLTHGMRRRGKRVRLFCHDLFEPFVLNGSVVDIRNQFQKNVAKWDCSPRMVVGDSSATACIHEHAPLDYCFVDGDHSYEGALADIRSFAPHVKPDGWLVIQDSKDDVARAIDDGLDPREWHRVLVTPPAGHFVTVCHRDPKRLEEFAQALQPVLHEAAAKAATGARIPFPAVS